KLREAPYDSCAKWRQGVWDRIEQEQPDLVLLAMFNNPGRLLEAPETDAATLWHDGLTATFEEIDGPQVAVLRDVPYQRRSPDQCLSMHLEDAPACAVPREEAFRENLMQAEDSAIAEAGDDVHGVDFTRYFCNAET